MQGRLNQAHRVALQVKQMPSEKVNASTATVANFLLGAVSFWKGDFELAQQEMEQGYQHYAADNRSEAILSSQIDLQPTLMAHLSWTYWIRGFPDRATQMGLDSIAKARQFAQPFTVALTLYWNLTTQVCCGNRNGNEDMLSELKFLSERHSLTYFSAISNIIQGQIEITQADVDLGQHLIQSGMENLSKQSSRLGQPWVMSILAEAFLQAKKFQEAEATLNRGLQLIEENGEHHWQAELHRLRAKVYLSSPTPDYEKANESLQQAITVAQSQKANSLHLRATLDLSLLLERTDKRQQAFDILATVYGKFNEGFDTLDLVKAKRVLQNLQVFS